MAKMMIRFIECTRVFNIKEVFHVLAVRTMQDSSETR